MSTGPFISDWVRLLVVLSIELGLMTTVFTLLQRFHAGAYWRRLLWRTALVGVLVLAACEVGGVGQWASGWFLIKTPSNKSVAVTSSNLDPTEEMQAVTSWAPRTETASRLPGRQSLAAQKAPAPALTWWPAYVWLTGSLLFFGRLLLARVAFAIGLKRKGRAAGASISRRVAELARLIDLKREVRVVALDALPAPVSYGAFSFGIVLPARFEEQYEPASQDAMLLHELAHVAARDGFWHGAGDVVVACFWWHPAVWWMRREMDAASELAADEASMVVDDGPRILAECLVVMARRLAAPAGLGWQGIQGRRFRSRVGRRVQRLLGLESSGLRPIGARQRWVGRVGVALISAAMVLAVGWVMHRRPGNSHSWAESWNASLGGMILAHVAAAEPESPSIDRIDWSPWSETAVAEAQAMGRPVLVFFTADWAVNAKVNEAVGLEVPAVRERLRALNVATLKADWTSDSNSAIEAELKAFGKTSVPLTLVYGSRRGIETLPDLLTPEIVLAALDRSIEAEAASTASITKSNVPASASPLPQVSTILFEAKALFESGKLAEAKTKLAAVLKEHPKNEAARHYLSLIDKAKPQPAVTSQRQNLNEQLDSLRVASFGGTMPLSKMVEKLSREVRAIDPALKGINFLINDPVRYGNVYTQSTPPLRTTEMVQHELAPDLVWGDLKSVEVRLDHPLRDATVRQLLDAIVKVAAEPLRYEVEDYGVVITSRVRPTLDTVMARSPTPLHTRWFKIDVHRTALALKTAPGSSAIAAGTNLFNGDAFLRSLRAHFEHSGVTFDGSKQLFFSDTRGMLMVRATVQDLDIIEQAVMTLNTPPPQVLIEARFCEVSADALSRLGFDWMLSNPGLPRPESTPTTNNSSSDVSFDPPALTKESAPEVKGILTERQADAVIRALSRRSGVDILSTPKVTTQSGRQAQIKVVEVRSVVTHLTSQAATNENTAMPQRPGGGRGGGSDGRFQLVPVVEPFESGPVLDVVPYVQPDGVTVELTLIASVKEFMGYDLEDEPVHIDQSPVRSGTTSFSPSLPPIIGPELSRERSRITSARSGTQPTPRPVYRLRQMVAPVRVWDGQTVVLAGGLDKLDLVRSKSVPVVGDLPYVGRFFRAEHLKKQQSKLVVLVTVRIIDPAGNLVHGSEDIPAGVPPQPDSPQK